MVREWDPRTASSAEISQLLETLNAAWTADLPDDPPWRDGELRGYLAEVMPGSRRISWIAQGEPADGSPALLGYGNVLLLGDIGVIEVLVHPAARRLGLARDLLEVAARRTYQEGFRWLGAEVVGGTPATGFYESLGFERQFLEIRGVLRFANVDWVRIEKLAAGLDPEYEVQFHPDSPPEPLIEAYTQAKAEARDDDGDPDLRPSSYDPQRLRDSIDCLRRRGMRPYIVLARHTASGAVVGLTEVVVPAQHPTRADQYDTIVARDHQGRGIDRAIKARMLLELRAAEPALAEVQTWNAPENVAMRQVNAELGFQPDREWWEYGVDVADLVHRLNGA
ncbi:GNAT family N-acetyltransferase [Micromonosporaceae bacterium DT194]|uniref:GNAT family N-acetyltransferase n=1 Tax=Melissospora conviva TaxID=3388432 RepID=UPI003C146578